MFAVRGTRQGTGIGVCASLDEASLMVERNYRVFRQRIGGVGGFSRDCQASGAIRIMPESSLMAPSITRRWFCNRGISVSGSSFA